VAIDLADAGGIESLSMRRLGQALRVEAMSLYNHVASKDDLLDGFVDGVVDEFELPTPGADWRAGLRRSAISAHDVLRRHPWAASLMATRPTRVGAARLRHMDATLGVMRLAGFSIVLTHHAFHVLDGYIVGFTLQEVSAPVSKGRGSGEGGRLPATAAG
jgi:AcrR family transcriptional regulator